MKSVVLFALIVLAVAVLSAPAAPADAIRVAYAGSMGTVMDGKIGPAFAHANGAEYQGIGQGAYGLAHLLESGQMRADVFVSITPGPMRLLIKSGLVKAAAPIASTQMVIAYSPESRVAKLFDQEGATTPWYKVLEMPGVRFGRTDPATDPQGQNIIFTFMLAEKYYHLAGLAKAVLGPTRNPAQIFTEPSLLARLESGQIDASSGYLSAVESQHLPYVKLPPEINLADPSYFAAWYSKAAFTTTAPDGRAIIATPQPLVFYAAALANAAHPELARKFVEYLRGAEGQRALRASGYGGPLGGALE